MLYSKSFDFKSATTVQSCDLVRFFLATIHAFDGADGSDIAKASIRHLVG